MHRAGSALWVQQVLSCLVCLIVDACSSNLDFSVENKLCTIEGECLPGYVCSPEHICIPVQVATARKPDAGLPAIRDASDVGMLDAATAQPIDAAADGGGPREPAMSMPEPEVDASVVVRKSADAPMPPAMMPAEIASNPTDAGATPDAEAAGGSSGAAARAVDASVAQPAAGAGGQSVAPMQPAAPQAGAMAPPEKPTVDAGMPACASGSTRCGSSCFELQRDAQHCGTCDRQCSAADHGAPRCDAGTCDLACESGWTRCGNACFHLDDDPAHCGECARTCSGGSGATPTCKRGQCGKECRSGLRLCGDACVDLKKDPANCNACGKKCASPKSATATCESGTCKVHCPSGQVECNGSCNAAWQPCWSFGD